MKQPVVYEPTKLPNASMLDQHLLQACRDGDEAAWNRLLDKYERLVYSIPLNYNLPFYGQERRITMAGNPELTFARLLDWAEGRLPAAETQTMAQQVATADAAIQTQVQWLTAFRKLSHHFVLAPLPSAVRTTLSQRFRAFVQTRQPPPFLQRVVAVLTFDSRHQTALAGLRATATEPVRQYVFVTDWADVALHIQARRSDQHLDLIGQVLVNTATLEADTIVVQLLLHEREVAITLADELGEFMFAAVEPGNYGLILSTDQVEIELPDFALTSE